MRIFVEIKVVLNNHSLQDYRNRYVWQPKPLSRNCFNPLTLRAAKRGLTILEIFNLQKEFLKTFEGEMLISSQTTNPLQIFCKISLHSQVIFKSMKVADDILRGTLECEWVKIAYGVTFWFSFPLNSFDLTMQPIQSKHCRGGLLRRNK